MCVGTPAPAQASAPGDPDLTPAPRHTTPLTRKAGHRQTPEASGPRGRSSSPRVPRLHVSEPSLLRPEPTGPGWETRARLKRKVPLPPPLCNPNIRPWKNDLCSCKPLLPSGPGRRRCCGLHPGGQCLPRLSNPGGSFACSKVMIAALQYHLLEALLGLDSGGSVRRRRLRQELSLSLVRDPAARFPDRLHTVSRSWLSLPSSVLSLGNFVVVKLSL